MSPEQKTIEQLERQAPMLQGAQKEALWKKIETSIVVLAPIPTPFLFSFIQTRSMTPLILAFMLVLGSTGTVLASNAARPGDVLYPVDRATEKVEGSLLRGEVKVHFTAQLAQERVDELHSLLNDDTKKNKDGQLSDDGKKYASEAAVSALQMVDDIHLNNETRHQLLVKLRAEMHGVDVGVHDDRLKEDEDRQDKEDTNDQDDDSEKEEHSEGNRGHDNSGRGEGRDNNRIEATASTTINLDTNADGGTFVPAGQRISRSDDDGDESEDDDGSNSTSHDSINLHINGEVELAD